METDEQNSGRILAFYDNILPMRNGNILEKEFNRRGEKITSYL